MKTPYDAALRLADRRVEDARVAIGRAVAALARAQAAHDRGAAALQRECLLAADDWRVTTERWFLQAREAHARLAAERDAEQARLRDLQRTAVRRYAERAAIDEAVARHRSESERAAAAAEQATVDDLAGSRLARVRRRRAAAAMAVAAAP